MLLEKKKISDKYFHGILLIIYCLVFTWSLVNPKNLFTWSLEVFPAVICLIVI